MIQTVSLRIPFDAASDTEAIKQAAAAALKISEQAIGDIRVLRRSLDARGSQPLFQIQVAVSSGADVLEDLQIPVCYHPVSPAKKVIIAGSGPAGLFAALRLIEHGIQPIILERGKDVRNRRFDLKTLNRQGICNQDSNYCFGEGGAGTYSDGKLYTRSTKRGNVKKMLSVLVQHGASKEILVDAHPHIGSNRLPKIIEAIRQTILACNGQIHFNARVAGLILKNGRINGVTTASESFTADAVVLATGHSARDIYHMLDRCGIALAFKPFAMGVRVEHPQELINTIQYGKHAQNDLLPAATYSLACQVEKTGVYSFCMCPGGMLVPAATAPEELVLNGMSNSQRNLPFANAGIVASVDDACVEAYAHHAHFKGLMFQQQMEKAAFDAGGRTLAAPAQRLTDFLNDRISTALPKTSYIPGAVSFPLARLMGPAITAALKQGFSRFDRKMKGFITHEALVLAVESRTSSPVRILRDLKTRMHPQILGLFPAGEGAGFAGGIVSSALDGEASADAVAGYIN